MKMKVSTMISKLQSFKKTHGNLDIYFSSDEEGNCIMRDAELSLYETYEDGGKVACLFPYSSL
jgi:hypothetical protein